MSKKSHKKHIEVSNANETARYGGSETGGDALTADKPEMADESGGTEALRAELAEAKDKLLRARAEQQNLAKRQANELVEAVRYANASLIKDLLETVDNFDRLMDQDGAADVEAVRKGARLIRDDLVRALECKGLAAIEALGKPFDPRCHEAMLQQPAPDAEPGTVIQVLQAGYVLGDRVLRPAKVVVSTAAENVGGDSARGAGEEECGAGAAARSDRCPRTNTNATTVAISSMCFSRLRPRR